MSSSGSEQTCCGVGGLVNSYFACLMLIRVSAVYFDHACPVSSTAVIIV
jgi:hypothetical protein